MIWLIMIQTNKQTDKRTHTNRTCGSQHLASSRLVVVDSLKRSDQFRKKSGHNGSNVHESVQSMLNVKVNIVAMFTVNFIYKLTVLLCPTAIRYPRHKWALKVNIQSTISTFINNNQTYQSFWLPVSEKLDIRTVLHLIRKKYSKTMILDLFITPLKIVFISGIPEPTALKKN